MDPIHWMRIAIDLAAIFFQLAWFLFLKYGITPFYSGFYCDDYSVNMPYKPSTVNNKLLIVLSTCLPLVVIVGTEFARTAFMKHKHHTLTLHNKYRVKYGRQGRFIEMPEQFGNVLFYYGIYLFGLLCNLNLTLVGKQTIGRLRPNFLSVCQPSVDVYAEACKNKKYLRPLEDFQCLNPNAYDIDESRKSFPSGHSSTIFYTCVFLILFIHRTWNRRNLGLLPQLAQLALVILAGFTALSRVIDNKHHPTDVMAGTVLGIVVAVFTFFYLNLFFRRYNYKSKYDNSVVGQVRISNDLEAGVGLDDVSSKPRSSYCTKTI